MQALLTAIVIWLSANFALPATFDYPRIEIVPPAEINLARREALNAGRQPGADMDRNQAARADEAGDVEAFYDDATRTIYLRQGWTGMTPAELSVLVHEMVHHLQNVAGLKYECPQAREKAAYIAQDQWLTMLGRSFRKEFGIDAITVLLRTNCMY